MTATDPLLTPSEVATELRVDKRTVLDLLRSGKLPHIDLGWRTKRVRRSALDQYLVDQEAGSGSQT